ncbi:MAG: Uma2 family endonuclease [Ktedonobacteraceae bacterium]
MPVEQYLALDDNTDGLYEYWHGLVIMLRPPSAAYSERAIVDMVGGSPTHAALSARLASLLDQGLPQDGSCVVYSSDVKLKLAEDHYVHPDVTVSCMEPGEGVLTHPTVLIEILSPNTEKRDRGAKLKSYKDLPSVQEYMLIGSEEKEIVVYRRENDWRPYHYNEGDIVELTSLGVSFPFDAVYRRIRLV